ncbi:MAG TPA: Do family serine endopeptidase [Steroidobacteraceae bacterium]|nr:Do family serine endopeptidase [Steroidobacteraceae bacterium]
MRKQAIKVLVLAAASVLFSVSAGAQLPEKVGDTPMPSLAPIVKKASPAVVNIATRGTLRESRRNPLLEDPFFRRFFDAPDLAPRERQFQSAGSGVIVDAKQGYIITNAHVIENADEITVTLLDDREIKAKVIGADKPSDVALLKITANNLVEMPLADSSKAEVGDFVLAIGNPFALSHTVTSGIISALGRSDGSAADSYQDFIQTDAPINPGNSGGALVNLQGQLVGVNSMIFSGSGGNIGIGFAIPSNMVKAVMAQLVQYGEVKRGMLGVQLSNQFTPEIAQSLGLETNRGAWVSEVVEGGAADKAGIKAGDVITSINGRTVANASELRNSIGLLRIGDKVDLGLLRDGKPRKVTAVIGERSGGDADAAAQIHAAFEGATLANGDGGVLIRTVAPGSPAAQSGFQPNDVILMIGRTQVANIEQLRAALKNVNSFAITIQRGRSRLVFPVG